MTTTEMSLWVNGDLPEGWALCPFKDTIAHVIGGDWGKSPNERPKGWLDVSVIRGTEFRDWDREKGKSAAHRCIKPTAMVQRQLQAGDLVIEISGGGPDQPVGRTLLIDEVALAHSPYPVICSNFCRHVRILTEILDPAFVYSTLRYLYSRGEFNRFQNQTVNIRNLQFPDFAGETHIPVAPLAEQKRIVAKVEALLERVNSARARLARVPAILKRFRQAVLAAACSGRLTEDWRMKRRSNLDTEWNNKRIGDIFHVTTGGTPSRKNPEFFKKGKIPWVKTGEVHNCDIYSSDEHITIKALESSSAKIFPAGTLLVALYGEGKTRGQIGRLMIDAATNQACAALVNPKIPPATNSYVFYYLLGQYYALREKSAGGNQPNLSVGLIREWQIRLPSLAEQREIARRVEALFKLADGIEARVAAATRRAEKLTQAILAKAFRGELVPTEAELARREGRDYEPASELLARIRAERAAAEPPSRNGHPGRTKSRTKKQPAAAISKRPTKRPRVVKRKRARR